MNRRGWIVGLVMVGLGATACGHHTPTAPTATSITIQSSSALLFLGVTEAFQAVITFSDGSTQTVTTGTWNTDAPAIATVDGTGHVTGVASGNVTIAVDAMGVHGTKAIRVLPNYGGTFTGNLLLVNCSSTGWTPTCSAIDDDLPHTLTFTLTQTGDTVTGTAAVVFVTTSITGTVATGGALTINAVGTNLTKSYTETWNLTSTTPGVITGTAHFDGTDSGSASQHISFQANVSNAVRH